MSIEWPGSIFEVFRPHVLEINGIRGRISDLHMGLRVNEREEKYYLDEAFRVENMSSHLERKSRFEQLAKDIARKRPLILEELATVERLFKRECVELQDNIKRYRASMPRKKRRSRFFFWC